MNETVEKVRVLAESLINAEQKVLAFKGEIQQYLFSNLDMAIGEGYMKIDWNRVRRGRGRRVFEE